MSGLVISGPPTPTDVAELCERVRLRLERTDADVLVCDVAALTRPDARTVEALARVQLTARRLGREVRLRDPSRELRELLDLFGLTDVLPAEGALRLEPLRQPEHREQPLGIEERVEMRDPPV